MAAKKQIKGIDVSKWNTINDFAKVKAAGYEFVIIRIGGTNFGDPKFYDYALRAKKAGLKIGAYFYASKISIGSSKGLEDAKYCLKLLQKYEKNGIILDYPIFYDYELPPNKNRGENTKACISFCDYLEKFNYFVGIYASDVSGFKNKLIHDQLKDYCHWVADYTGETTVCKDYQIRQISSKGSVPGIKGNVDIDIDYVNLATIISKAKKNRSKTS